MRDNNGGDASLARKIAGCFLNKGTLLWTVETMEGGTKIETVHQSSFNEWCRRPKHNDLFFALNENTASVAELLPFILKNRGRATVLGGSSMGASHSVEFFELAGGFGAIIPIGRTYDPKTRTSYELVGVVPDICLPANAPIAEYVRIIEASTLADQDKCENLAR